MSYVYTFCCEVQYIDQRVCVGSVFIKQVVFTIHTTVYCVCYIAGKCVLHRGWVYLQKAQYVWTRVFIYIFSVHVTRLRNEYRWDSAWYRGSCGGSHQWIRSPFGLPPGSYAAGRGDRGRLAQRLGPPPCLWGRPGTRSDCNARDNASSDMAVHRYRSRLLIIILHLITQQKGYILSWDTLSTRRTWVLAHFTMHRASTNRNLGWNLLHY